MKKLLLLLVLAFGISATISSCSDDTVSPLEETDNGGGGASDPILP